MNKVMEIVFNNGVIQADYQTGMVSLNDVMAVGNMMRARKGLEPYRIDNFWRGQDIAEFLFALCNKEGLLKEDELHYIDVLKTKGKSDTSDLRVRELAEVMPKNLWKSLDKDEQTTIINELKSRVVKSKKGGTNKGSTFGHILLAMKLATWLDKDFEVEVYDTFVKNKIINLRNLGCDSFKELNSLVYRYIDCGRLNKEDVVKELSTMVNKKVNNGVFIAGWDNDATVEQQEKRAEINKELKMLINKGYIKTYNDLVKYFI